MNFKQSIMQLGYSEAIKAAQQAADELGMNWSDGICYVFKAIAYDSERAPANIGGSKDDSYTAIRKWMSKYKKGYDERASQHRSNPPSTVTDPIIEKIIGARLGNNNGVDLTMVKDAHRLGMSAENILGLILEEYLAENLKGYGWHCAWGETVKSVDFVNENGEMLQIKNRSNSENSSSSAIRNSTPIQKWYRIKANRVEYMWDDLNQICGTSHLNEEDFKEYAIELIKKNPNCLAIDSGSKLNPESDLLSNS